MKFVFYILFLLLLVTLLCLLFRKSRRMLYIVAKSLWENLFDKNLSKAEGESVLIYILGLCLLTVVVIIVSVIFIIIAPSFCFFTMLKNPGYVDDMISFEKELLKPRPIKPQEASADREQELRRFNDRMMSSRFDVERKGLYYVPDEHEIFYYTPVPSPEVEKLIADNLSEIQSTFSAKGYRFVFLPDLNRQFRDGEVSRQFDYFNPARNDTVEFNSDILSYADIQESFSLPARVDSPCFIRCMREYDDPLPFSFWKIQIHGSEGIIDTVNDYLSHVGNRRLYNFKTDEQIRQGIEGLSADERFDTDVYLIGKEIRDRIEQLRAKGLSSLAIRKLIGDDSDKPGKLLIDRHNRLILTDYGNKEIKLSPIHKAVFFLFLRHPEGIYFKDLANYKEELGRIYKEITGREDLNAVEDSINKLTDPYDNSINEKCARIKNAFVSEFREEVAQWYFIDGSKGEKKSIKLPRELVTWEIKD